MSLPPETSAQSGQRELCPRSTAATSRALILTTLLCAGFASSAQAQSWSKARTRPLLRQIVSVDESGEAPWPFGPEDIAKDGLTTFAADEAGTDVRTVYADADAERLWLRAYVAAESAPPTNVVAFFFADTDDRDQTGGPAFGEPLWPAWTSDPTPGGYERAVGVRTDGTLLGVWSWDVQAGAWTALRPRKDGVHVEVGRDEDPIRIGATARGYLQADLVHGLSGLSASCAGNLFVRVWHDAPAPRSFGDDDAEVFTCQPRIDRYGDPVVLRSAGCGVDADCPNGGRCRDSVCLFAYACSSNADCRSDERCTGNACIKVVTNSCSDSAECQGLVCENGTCVACSESGTRACKNGLLCSPNGSCVDPTKAGKGSSGGADAGAGAGLADAGMVRGGAFHCALTARDDAGLTWSPWWWAMAGALLVRRRSRRERVSPCARNTP